MAPKSAATTSKKRSAAAANLDNNDAEVVTSPATDSHDSPTTSETTTTTSNAVGTVISATDGADAVTEGLLKAINAIPAKIKLNVDTVRCRYSFANEFTIQINNVEIGRYFDSSAKFGSNSKPYFTMFIDYEYVTAIQKVATAVQALMPKDCDFVKTVEVNTFGSAFMRIKLAPKSIFVQTKEGKEVPFITHQAVKKRKTEDGKAVPTNTAVNYANFERLTGNMIIYPGNPYDWTDSTDQVRRCGFPFYLAKFLVVNKPEPEVEKDYSDVPFIV